MEGNLLFPAEGADFRDGLNGADFVVGCHDRNQNGIVADGFANLRSRDKAFFVHRQVRHFKTLLFQPLAGMQNGMMLDGGGDDMVALLPILERDALYGKVVRFGSAPREIHFIR
ncbi:hypothetical protein SDC9_196763 [bioreactor metagenome]|uniref:Uncharacterized protein n=1 Tax=bioreactor metagenome TaxID=1076179 RepID=A0A645IF98_9ZZZZ